MSSSNVILNELSYLVKVLKYLGMFGNYKKRNNRRRTPYVIAFLIMSLTIWTYVYKIQSLKLQRKNGIMNNVLSFFYATSLWFKCTTFCYTILTQKSNMQKLWNGFTKLDKIASALKLHPDSQKLNNLLLLVIPYLVNIIITINMAEDKIEFWDYILHFVNLILHTFEFGMKLNYTALLTLFKNYFKQINQLLMLNNKLKEDERVIIVNNVAICYQQMMDLINTALNIMTMEILALTQEHFVLMVNHIYFLIVYFWFKDETFSPILSIFYTLDALYYIGMLIIPATLCANAVSNTIIYSASQK